MKSRVAKLVMQLFFVTLPFSGGAIGGIAFGVQANAEYERVKPQSDHPEDQRFVDPRDDTFGFLFALVAGGAVGILVGSKVGIAISQEFWWEKQITLNKLI